MNSFFKNKYLIFGVLVSIIAFLIYLTQSTWYQINASKLSSAITIDFLISVPVIYYLLIRKSDSIPKITVASVFIICTLIAGFIIPAEDQTLLKTMRKYLLPIVELIIVFYVLYQVREIVGVYKTDNKEGKDFFSALKEACQKILSPKIGNLFATEIAVFYYLFSKNTTLKNVNYFSYHKTSGIQTVIIVFLFLAFIEVVLVHYLLNKYSPKLAWIISFLGLYPCFQIIANLRAMKQRPIIIDEKENNLILRHGIFNETIIPIEKISDVKLSRKTFDTNEEAVLLSPFGILDNHNVVIKLLEPHILEKIYGLKKSFTTIGIYIDNKELFLNKLKEVGTFFDHKNQL